MDKLLSAEELAELIGVPLGTVYKWNYAGGGPNTLGSRRQDAAAGEARDPRRLLSVEQ